MKCEFNYCIYQQNGECILDEIQIDQLGMCSECILVSLNDELVEKSKKFQLEIIEKSLLQII